MDHIIVTCIAGIIILTCGLFKFTSYQYHKKQREWQRKLDDMRRGKLVVYPSVDVIQYVSEGLNKNILIDTPSVPLHTSVLIKEVNLDSGKPMPLVSISLPTIDVSKIEKYDGLKIKDLKIY